MSARTVKLFADNVAIGYGNTDKTVVLRFLERRRVLGKTGFIERMQPLAEVEISSAVLRQALREFTELMDDKVSLSPP